MIRCARCDWKPDPTAQQPGRALLAEHATEHDHPLCQVCQRSLPLEQTLTCDGCIHSTTEQLASIVQLWLELPDHLTSLRGQRLDGERPAAGDGRPLPGGDVLVLLAGGSEGLADDPTTSRDGDAPSVTYLLGWWEGRWRTNLGFTGAPARRRSAQVPGCAQWLTTFTPTAARDERAGFAGYAADLRDLLARLERATGHDEHESRAEAECFDCGADALVRKVTARGYADQWTCQRCGRRYGWQEYVLACRARVETGRDTLRLSGWGTPAQVAAACGTPIETVRTWVKRGQVGSVCSVESKAMLVWFPDADTRAESNRRRSERPSAPVVDEQTKLRQLIARLSGQRTA